MAVNFLIALYEPLSVHFYPDDWRKHAGVQSLDFEACGAYLDPTGTIALIRYGATNEPEEMELTAHDGTPSRARTETLLEPVLIGAKIGKHRKPI